MKTYLASIIYKISGWAAFIAAILFRRNMDAEYFMLHELGLFSGNISSAPQYITAWFRLMQTQPILGLVLLNFLDLINYFLVAIIFLTSLSVVWKHHQVLSAIAGLCTVSSVGYYFYSNQSLPIYRLSNYSLLASPAEQKAWVSLGTTLLNIHESNSYSPTGIYPSYLLISIAGLLLAWTMMPSKTFTPACAWMGILANSFALSYYLFHFFLPEFEFLGPSLSAVFLLIWYIQIGNYLLGLAKRESKKPVIPLDPLHTAHLSQRAAFHKYNQPD